MLDNCFIANILVIQISLKKKYNMVVCVAYGCDSKTGTSMSLFKFPKDPKRKKTWLDQLNRAHTATKNFVPSTCSRLCMKHFDDDQYIINPQFAESIGYNQIVRVKLKPDAIPKVFQNPTKKPPKGRRSALAITRKKFTNEVGWLNMFETCLS